MALERHYSPRQIAEKLGCQRRTIYEHLKAGKLAAVKLPGRRWKISESNLQRYLKPNNQ